MVDCDALLQLPDSFLQALMVVLDGDGQALFFRGRLRRVQRKQVRIVRKHLATT